MGWLEDYASKHARTKEHGAVVFTINGEKKLPEHTLDHWEGYRGFTGPEAMQEYANLVGGGTGPRRVPVENHGGAGTRDSHWREGVFGNELMTGFVGDAPNPLSRLTIASLSDLGYEVDFSAAEAYSLPGPHLLAEAGAVLAHDTGSTRIVLPSIPIVLQEESLR